MNVEIVKNTANATRNHALLIFDLNKTLCLRIHHKDAPKELLPGYTKISNGYLYKRPHLNKLLQYLCTSDYWQMAVYTTMTQKNGSEIIDEIFAEYKEKLIFTKYGTQEDYNSGNTSKTVKKIAQLYPHLENMDTLIIDDTLSKIYENKPHEYYLIPSFCVDDYYEMDNSLLTLMTHLILIEKTGRVV